MTIRRQVGGYAYRDELERMKRLSEENSHDLKELGKHAQSKETWNLIFGLMARNGQIATKAMELREYRDAA